jgi:hypothetical protein
MALGNTDVLKTALNLKRCGLTKAAQDAKHINP